MIGSLLTVVVCCKPLAVVPFLIAGNCLTAVVVVDKSSVVEADILLAAGSHFVVDEVLAVESIFVTCNFPVAVADLIAKWTEGPRAKIAELLVVAVEPPAVYS